MKIKEIIYSKDKHLCSSCEHDCEEVKLVISCNLYEKAV